MRTSALWLVLVAAPALAEELTAAGEPDRFASRFALHGGPKFTSDGRYVYFGSRDGWITKFDLWNLKVIAEVRAGINTRNVAVSDDGKYVIAANYLPRNLVLFDADLNPVKLLEASSLDGKEISRVAAVYDAAPRKSFVAAMKDMPELWEISYDEKAKPIFDGYVHDYRMQEGIAKPGFLNPRRTPLTDVLDDFFFDQSYTEVMGASREGKGQVVNLDVRRKVADAGRSSLRAGDTMARIGGDEFAILLPMTGDQEAKKAIERFRDTLVPALGESFRATVSIGLVTTWDNGPSAVRLLKAADATMYEVKNAGKDGIGHVCLNSRQEREREDHGERDDDRAAEPHGEQVRALEEEEPREPGRDGSPREQHHASDLRERAHERLLVVVPRRELLAVAAHREERVVDRHAEPDQRADVDRVLGHVGEVGQPEHRGAAFGAVLTETVPANTTYGGGPAWTMKDTSVIWVCGPPGDGAGWDWHCCCIASASFTGVDGTKWDSVWMAPA